MVANKFNTNHHLATVEPEKFSVSLRKTIYHCDEPFGDSFAIPTSYVSKYASENVKMVLTGDGGDEVLSGYNSYLGLKILDIYNKIPSIITNSSLRLVKTISPMFKGNIRYTLNKMESIAEAAKMPFNERMIHKMAYADYAVIKSLVKNIDTIPVEEYYGNLMKQCPFQDEFYKLMYFDFKHSLPDDYLVKVDRMSMANSLEARIPFLDYRLVEFMAGVDKNVKMQGFECKSVLRKTIGKQLPKGILNAPKRGFGIPLREWFKDDSFDSNLNGLYQDNYYLDTNVVKEIVKMNKSGEKDYGNFIWTMSVLQNIMN